MRVARAASPLRVVVFGVDGAPVATAALDLSALGAAAPVVCLRGAPAFLGAPEVDVVFEVSRVS